MKKLIILILLLSPSLGFSQTPSIDEYYDVLSASHDIDQVEIFVVGESHNVPMDTKMQDQVAIQYEERHNSRSKNLFLHEGPSLGDGFHSFAELRPGGRYYNLKRKLRDSGYYSNNYLASWDNEYGYNKAKEHYSKILGHHDIMSSEESSTFKKATTYMGFLFTERKANKAMDYRNRSMAEVIKFLGEPKALDFQVFIFAGSLHLTENEHLVEALEESGRPYIVLNPRKDHPARIQTQSGIEYAKELLDK